MLRVPLFTMGNDYLRHDWTFPITTPLGTLAIGSYLVEHGIPVDLIDIQMDIGFGLTTQTEHAVYRRATQYLQENAEDIAWVGISQMFSSDSCILLAKEIHAALPQTPIVLGGYFPTTNYRQLLEQAPFITAIVRGDGEKAALHISNNLVQEKSIPFDQIPNLAWFEDGKIRTTPIQPVPLDKSPIFDFSLLRNRACYQTADIITARGCPFHCNYCLEEAMRPYATYALEWVEQQMAHMKANLECRYISIVDPIFGLGHDHLRNLCSVLEKHDFAYAIESRADVLPIDSIPDLRQAGVDTIYLGVESASPATLLRMNKIRKAENAEKYLQQALEILKSCLENNITLLMGFMLGFPGDSESDLKASLEFAQKAQATFDQIAARKEPKAGFIPYPMDTKIYPGCSLTEHLEEYHVILKPETGFKESTILSPSPGLDLETTLRYVEKIDRCARYPSRMFEATGRPSGFSVKDFVEANPELKDDQGIVTLYHDAQHLLE
jgi:anaerobic magnesium-protoporphyrin IX monomethyl ester cyclase